MRGSGNIAEALQARVVGLIARLDEIVREQCGHLPMRIPVQVRAHAKRHARIGYRAEEITAIARTEQRERFEFAVARAGIFRQA